MGILAEKIIRKIRQIVDGFLVIVFVVMFGAVLLQIGLRSLTSYSLIGTEETANFAQLWLVLVGAGVALRFSRHVAVDILINMFSEKVRYYISSFNSIAIFWFLYIIFKGSIPLIDMGLFERSPAMGIPMWVMYSSLMVGSVYMALELLLSICPAWQTREAPEINK